MGSGPGSRAVGLTSGALRVCSNLFSLLFLPGVVVHELGHYLVCRALGVEATVTVQLWPDGLTGPSTSRGHVTFEAPTAPWKSACISVGPFLSNTVGALLAHWMVRWALLPSAVTPSVAENVPFLDQYVHYFWAAGTGRQVLSLGAFWLGVSLAFTAMPSLSDVVHAGTWLRNRLKPEHWLSPTAGALVQHGVDELEYFYGLVVVTVGLFGVSAPIEVLDVYLLIFLLGLPVFGLRRLEFGRGWGSPPPAVQAQRAEVLFDRAHDGESITDADVDTLVSQLASADERVRYYTARALWAVAERAEPAVVAERAPTIRDRVAAEDSTRVANALLSALSYSAAYVDLALLVESGMDALTGNDETLRAKAPELLAKAAAQEPARLEGDVERLVAVFETLPVDARENLALAIALVAEAEPAAVASHAETLARFQSDDSEAVGERVDRVLDAIEDGDPIG